LGIAEAGGELELSRAISRTEVRRVFIASAEDIIKNLDTYGEDFAQHADPGQLR
jgi:hypothetical protein